MAAYQDHFCSLKGIQHKNEDADLNYHSILYYVNKK